MDGNLKGIVEKRIRRTVEALGKNGFDAHYIEGKEALLEKLAEYIQQGTSCSVGGSMTLFETGVIDWLRSCGCDFADRYAPGADIPGIYRAAFHHDVYLCSANAITQDGRLYNVDGNGNRVAALTFGPQKVVVIAGYNKIVKDIEEARQRVKATAAPANNARLDTQNPCTKLGFCADCTADRRICVTEVVTGRQISKNRIAVLLLPESYGY